MKRVLLACTILILTCSSAFSQVSFPYVIEGRGSLGMCVYGEADFNQDGYRDLVARMLGYMDFIYSGKDFTLLDSIRTPAIEGDNYSITSLDANNDGIPDLVLAGCDFEGHLTVFYIAVYSGKDWSMIYKTRIPTGILSLDKISDLNGDLVDDILVGNSTTSLVVSGKDGSQIRELGIPSYVGVIRAIADLDSDGFQDIAVSSDRNGFGDPNGAVVILSGNSGAVLKTIMGNGAGFGNTMTTCPDQDGDGIEDLVVAQTGGEGDSALVYSTLTGDFIGPVKEPVELDGVFGSFMGNLGDYNGDGIEDFVISDLYGTNFEDPTFSGASFVFSGADCKLLYSFFGVPFSEFGLSVTSIGDLNGDGRQEIAIGAPFNSKVYIFSAYLPGDANQDGRITLADAVIKIRFLFHNGPRPLPMSVADDNCDGTISLSDIICALNYLFGKGTQDCCIK